jgi:hypothetical protein
MEDSPGMIEDAPVNCRLEEHPIAGLSRIGPALSVKHLTKSDLEAPC